MTLEENKALARRAIDEVWSKGNLAVAADVYVRTSSAINTAILMYGMWEASQRSSSSCASFVKHSQISTTRSTTKWRKETR